MFITNIQAPPHLLRKENLVKCEKISKYYDHDHYYRGSRIVLLVATTKVQEKLLFKQKLTFYNPRFLNKFPIPDSDQGSQKFLDQCFVNFEAQ